jgi:hypothetical protein
MPSLIVVPAALPLLRVSPHAFSPQPTVRERPRDQGESRTRPRFRGAPPQVLTGEWMLTQEEFDVFYAWHEDDLRAGTEPFDIQVEAQGGGPVGGLTWWTVRLRQTAWETLGLMYWRVFVELLLVDEIGEFRVAPGLMARGSIVFAGHAVSPGPGVGAQGSIVFGGYAVAPVLPARAQGSIVFGGYAIAPGLEVDVRITTLGDTRVTTSGDRRIRGE